MPSNILNADTGFPSFTEGMTNDQKIDKVMNYLYMLLEQLRYTFANLGVDNFNDAEIDDLAKIITEPVYIRLQDEMGNLTSLQVTVDGLTSRVQNTEGDITVLQQTADSISTRVQNNEGKISQVTQTADGLVSRVSTAEGNISSLTQTADGLVSRVSTAEGNISSLTQTSNGLTSRVSTAEGNISSLTQTANSLKSRISNAEGEVSEIWQEIDGIGLVVSDGELNAASIVAAINDSGSRVMIEADKIEMTGTTSFITEKDVGDNGSTVIAGNRISIAIDGSEDYGNNDLESSNGLCFDYIYSVGEGIWMARLATSIDGEDSDVESRYALNIKTYAFENENGDFVRTALKLSATGRVSIEGAGLYMEAWSQTAGAISMQALFNTRIIPIASYGQLEDLYDRGYTSAKADAGYCFCTDGIYYKGSKILST